MGRSNAAPLQDQRAALSRMAISSQRRRSDRHSNATTSCPGLAVGHANDHIAIPRPGMFAIVLARLRRMIGVRMIPADHVQILFASRFLRIATSSAVSEKRLCGESSRRLVRDRAPKLRAAALARRPARSLSIDVVSPQSAPQHSCGYVSAVLSNSLCDVRAHFSVGPVAMAIHPLVFVPKAFAEYFAPESAKTVTMNACWSRGTFAATTKQPARAAAALGLTSSASSRASASPSGMRLLC